LLFNFPTAKRYFFSPFRMATVANTEPEKFTETKFSWDYDVPNTPFWSDLQPDSTITIARNFLTCFSQSEVEDMNLDDTLDKDQKLHLLFRLLREKLTARDAEVFPQLLHDVDYSEWQRLMIGIETMQKFLGLPEEEDTLRIIMENGKDGKRNMSGVNMMAGFKEKHGLYSEAETLAQEVLPFMQGHEILGPDSPQTFGTTRTLIRSIWKQNREEEARKLVEDTSNLIEKMGDGKFRKYQAEERNMLQNLVVELEKWSTLK
jgi:hypothetical protein